MRVGGFSALTSSPKPCTSTGSSLKLLLMSVFLIEAPNKIKKDMNSIERPKKSFRKEGLIFAFEGIYTKFRQLKCRKSSPESKSNQTQPEGNYCQWAFSAG